MGLPGARSVENCTEIVEPAATLAPVGDTDTTVRAAGGGRRRGRRLVEVQMVGRHQTGAGDDEHGQAHDEDRSTSVGPMRRRTCSPDIAAGILLGTIGGSRVPIRPQLPR